MHRPAGLALLLVSTLTLVYQSGMVRAAIEAPVVCESPTHPHVTAINLSPFAPPIRVAETGGCASTAGAINSYLAANQITDDGQAIQVKCLSDTNRQITNWLYVQHRALLFKMVPNILILTCVCARPSKVLGAKHVSNPE